MAIQAPFLGDRLDGRCGIGIGGVGVQCIPQQADDRASDEQGPGHPLPLERRRSVRHICSWRSMFGGGEVSAES
jgi:hypothetical protein